MRRLVESIRNPYLAAPQAVPQSAAPPPAPPAAPPPTPVDTVAPQHDKPDLAKGLGVAALALFSLGTVEASAAELAMPPQYSLSSNVEVSTPHGLSLAAEAAPSQTAGDASTPADAAPPQAAGAPSHDASTPDAASPRTATVPSQAAGAPSDTAASQNSRTHDIAGSLARAGDGWRVDFGQSNESFGRFGRYLPSRDRRPGLNESTDNGWTAGLMLDVTHTEGDRQTVVSGRFEMLTEQGSWDVPPPTGYGARRTDLAQITVQHNFRESLDAHNRFVYGYGGGISAVGPLGGYDLQQGFHELGWFGGRLGPEQGLQDHYTSHNVHFAPVFTGGVGLEHDLNASGSLMLRGSLTGNVVAGDGISGVSASVGVAAQPFSWLRTSADVRVDGVVQHGRQLDFYNADGVRPGWRLRAEGTSSKWITPFVELQQGGYKEQTQYLIGVSIPLGGGSRPWLPSPNR